MLYVAINFGRVAGSKCQEFDWDCSNIEPQYAVSDPRVVALVLNMRDEIRSGCHNGKLYAEALSLALAARLQARYSREPSLGSDCTSTLSPLQIARIREYVRANLASDIGVADLAGQVNLSPHYFSRLFKRALGVPPHRYVLQERIHEAQRQLALGRTAIAELALNLGFADQSHFSRAFRKATGATPGECYGSMAIRKERDPEAGCALLGER
jgi:AraC family transcriptional regulator